METGFTHLTQILFVKVSGGTETWRTECAGMMKMVEVRSLMMEVAAFEL
jgi:hypothetical protein